MDKMDDIPVKVGIVYEGERIRRPETFLELGGSKVKYKAELVQVRKENEIKDGNVILIG
ncbi:MAG: acetyl-CoA decarbonylase/synthase complex subunit beta, partial [Candidatus Altiarchaeales archaeon]